MIRKDYQLIAGCVKIEADRASRDGWESKQTAKAWKLACAAITLNLADALASDNPAFNREKFLQACGV